MIIIKLRNHHHIVAREKGRLVSTVAPFFVNVEDRVEREIVAQIQKIFDERDIEADITVVHESGSAPESPNQDGNPTDEG